MKRLMSVLMVTVVCYTLFTCMATSCKAAPSDEASSVGAPLEIVTNAQIDEQIAALHKRQADAHQMAESARALGYPEDNYIISQARSVWWDAYYKIGALEESRPVYTDRELRLLAMVIYYEANGCADRHQQLVAMVVLNRMHAGWADNIFDVIEQDGAVCLCQTNR